MLTIEDLKVSVDGTQVLDGLSLHVPPGQLHVVMGPNGAGKSTLSSVLTGRDGFKISGGKVDFKGRPLLDMKVEERAREGLFLAFQYPVEIPGVSIMSFLKASCDAMRKARGESEITPGAFLALVREKAEALGFNADLLKRSVNHGFSGGEKKLFEVLQMMLLEPDLAVLDETDSGLDVDALRRLVSAINNMRDSARSFLLITHYQSLLSHIKPDYIHILCKGKIKRSGQVELLVEIEKNGFENICC